MLPVRTHSFPTRRSSDLAVVVAVEAGEALAVAVEQRRVERERAPGRGLAKAADRNALLVEAVVAVFAAAGDRLGVERARQAIGIRQFVLFRRQFLQLLRCDDAVHVGLARRLARVLRVLRPHCAAGGVPDYPPQPPWPGPRGPLSSRAAVA